ncbi:MAG: NAD(P)/FAD-dependent oxidoreductase [Clostridia bacterium]|nr:NAD(P)/FAD-dependent oxidoreductase [Clostridia bacterium]
MIITDIKTDIYASEYELEKEIIRKTGYKPYDYKVRRRSVDSRHGKINYVYTVEVLKSSNEVFEKTAPVISAISPHKRPVIVGAGPSGLFCAYVLAQAGARPIVLERGKPVHLRKIDVEKFSQNGILNIDSNVQFGEGGAGTFSDGKLMSGINDPLMRYMTDIFIECGAKEEISFVAKPHIGTDALVDIVKNLRIKIEENGGNVIFNSKMTDISINNGGISTVVADKEYETDDLILAIGHSARDTFSMLNKKGINLQAKPFSVGVRIEHSQDMINSVRYGKGADIGILGAADYKLSYHTKENRGVYTFCMCPGGFVVASSSDEGGVVTNGMSYSDRGGVNANSALLVSVGVEDFQRNHPLSGFEFQRKIEEKAFMEGGGNYFAPCQLLGDYLKNEPSDRICDIKPTYKPGIKLCNLNKIFPEFINDSIKEAIPVFERKLKGFANDNAVLTAPETRSSSPVKIPRDKQFMCNINGIYPIGEGAGYAGGITSSAVDGIRCALNIINKYVN